MLYEIIKFVWIVFLFRKDMSVFAFNKTILYSVQAVIRARLMRKDVILVQK